VIVSCIRAYVDAPVAERGEISIMLAGTVRFLFFYHTNREGLPLIEVEPLLATPVEGETPS
jgi:hypothetical protein